MNINSRCKVRDRNNICQSPKRVKMQASKYYFYTPCGA